MHSD